MKRVLITGSEGQLGTALKKESSRYQIFEYDFIDIGDLDLTQPDEVARYFENNRYDYIVNCAAFTAVDLAEEKHELAYKVNAKIPELLLAECMKGTRLVHLSTDYVYDGPRNTPFTEDEIPAPVSVYAKSKLAGEEVLNNNPHCLILRTSWLYSEFGNNFLKTMIRLSAERSQINVVYDQTGTPTYAGDLADVILNILLFSEESGFRGGIYNYSNEGVCSWYDFACEIMKYTNSKCVINPIRSFEYPVVARRPAYSVMDKSKIKRIFGIRIPHWRDSLFTAIHNLKANNI